VGELCFLSVITASYTKITAANDFAEHGVALIQDYSQILTKDEEQHRLLSSISISFLMQRRQDPNSNMTLHN